VELGAQLNISSKTEQKLVRSLKKMYVLHYVHETEDDRGEGGEN
jgi:hypothetical protein